MPYTPDPNDPTQPTEDKYVESAAAEFRSVKSVLGNFLAYPTGELATYKGPLPAAASRAGKVLAFNAVDGKPEAGPSIGDISGAAASAVAAAASAFAADASADAAAISEANAAASAASVDAANLLTKTGNLAGLANPATARGNLGLVIGTDVLAPTGSGASLTGFKKIAQIVRFETQNLGSSTATITLDDSIPQITEGDQFITQAFTPVNAGSTLYVRVEIPVFNRNAVGQCIIAGLFLNDDTNAKAVASVNTGVAAAWDGILTISKSMTAWSGAKTFSVRMGGSAGSLFYTNGRPATLGTLGVRQTTSLEIIEVLP